MSEVQGTTRNNQEKVSSWVKVQRVVWDNDDKTAEERATVRRLDATLLVCAFITYFGKYLDQANISNAYASGMKEALGFTGVQYNILTSLFTVGYYAGSVPGPLLMRKFKPSIFLPALEITWSVLVMLCAIAKNVKTLYALRFLIGLAEATSYPGILYLLGCWYTPSELAKRSFIFISGASVGTMCSGYLQTAVLGLEGKAGRAGWQWLFIVDGCISIGIAIIGMFLFPDTPSDPNPRSKFWLREKDIDIVERRLLEARRAPAGKLTLKIVKKALKSPVLWIMFIPYAMWGLGNQGYLFFNLFLKAEKYSLAKINLLPTGGFGLGLAVGLMQAWGSDFTRNRWAWVAGASVISFVGNAILAAWPKSRTLKLAAFYLNFAESNNGALLIVWINELLTENAETRVVIIGILSSSIYYFNSWIPILAFPANEAPHYKVGYKISAVALAVQAIGLCVAGYLFSHSYRPKPATDAEGEVEQVHTIAVGNSEMLDVDLADVKY